MLVPFLMTADGGFGLDDVETEISILFPNLFIDLLFFETGIKGSPLLIYFLLFFFKCFRQNPGFVVVNLQQSQQHLFVFYFSQSILLMGDSGVMIQRMTLSCRFVNPYGRPRL